MKRRDVAVYGPGGERYCPRCGTRVAQQADTCFQCGVSLRTRPRHIRIPFADIIGVLLITFLVWAWWQTRGRERSTLEAAYTATASARALLATTPTATATPSPTSTPTVTPTPTPTATPTPTPHIYIVQPNDTLLALSAEFGVPVERLAQVNGLAPGQGLRVGQRLVIPPAEGPLAPTPTPTHEAGLINYIVQEGDTVVLVAERFQTSVEAIVQANNLGPMARLRPGMVLVVPVGAPVPTPTPTPFSTPTPTPGPRYPAPIIILPPDGTRFQGEETRVRLAWTAVGYLEPGEVYRVSLRAGDEEWMYDTVQPFLVLPASFHPALQAAGGTARWSVQVVDTTKHPPLPRSAPSEERTFSWH